MDGSGAQFTHCRKNMKNWDIPLIGLAIADPMHNM
jgi:hypothetical protein